MIFQPLGTTVSIDQFLKAFKFNGDEDLMTSRSTYEFVHDNWMRHLRFLTALNGQDEEREGDK